PPMRHPGPPLPSRTPNPRYLLGDRTPRRSFLRAAVLAFLLPLAALRSAGAGPVLPEVSMPGRFLSRWQRPVPLAVSPRGQLNEADALVRAGEARESYGLSGSGLAAAVLDTGL